ncbi:hypothetical protein [Demequina mangrovi]|uniref:TadE-like protein n=1 Tax=Demequina mangrovi TaxID=1043493 RepID=A0A1H7APU4_9MICO|nr:hypothetical protein [Demequina mangrovi]SEJ64102.1 hypothetical protein SAMN05421637_2529 [Demequina mangrovi]
MRRRDDRGAATLELALVLPAAVVVLAFMLGAVQAAAAGLAGPAAALAGARAATVEGDDAGEAAARRAMGRAATVVIARDGGWVQVTVEVDLGWPWGARTSQAALPAQG